MLIAQAATLVLIIVAELERCLSGRESVLLLQKTRIWFPALRSIGSQMPITEGELTPLQAPALKYTFPQIDACTQLKLNLR